MRKLTLWLICMLFEIFNHAHVYVVPREDGMLTLHVEVPGTLLYVGHVKVNTI